MYLNNSMDGFWFFGDWLVLRSDFSSNFRSLFRRHKKHATGGATGNTSGNTTDQASGKSTDITTSRTSCTTDNTTTDSQDSADQEFEVDSLWGMRTRRKRRVFLIEWTPYNNVREEDMSMPHCSVPGQSRQ